MKQAQLNLNCSCQGHHKLTKLVVLTGGPGAGKTAILEIAKRQLCSHVAIFPEAASIIFNGGFWRLQSVSAKMSSQRAIYHVQCEMENLVLAERSWGLGLCDRGTLDGLAYWPAKESLFWKNLNTTKKHEFAKYAAVIHLRTPTKENGYNFQNPLRIESSTEASEIDDRIAKIWRDHPGYQEIESTKNFLDKVESTLALILKEIPLCCKK